MGWFDEQIRQRKLNDQKVYEDSFSEIANAIMGKKINYDFDMSISAKNAIEQILKYYGFASKGLPRDIKDFNAQLEYLCRPHGLMYRSVTLTPGWHKDAIGAFLGFYKENNEPVAFIPGIVSGYVFIKDGETIALSMKNEKLFKEEAYCFYKPFPLRKITAIDLAKYGFSCMNANDFGFTLLIMGITTIVGLMTPRISHFLTSTVIEEKSLSLLLSTLFFSFSLFLGNLIFGIFKSMINDRMNTRISVNVAAASMMRVISLPASFFRKFASGDLNTRVSYLTSLTQTIVNTIMSTGLTSLFSLAYISSIFKYAPSLVVPSLVITFLTIALSIVSSAIYMKRSKLRMELMSKESGMSYAMITGIQKIKLAGAEKRAFARWANLYAKESEQAYRPEYVGFVSTIISAIGTIVMYYIAAKTNISVADYYAFNSAYGMVSGAFTSAVSLVMTFANIKPTLEMAKPIMDEAPEIVEGKEVLTRIFGGIELNDVTFRYDDNGPNIIDGMSLKIKPGQYVAIVGKTGCGKSTLIRLLLGFEKPQKGAIYYDGKDIKDVDLKSLRKKIGCVTQDGKLFMGDIFSNITISAPWLSLDEAWEAADIAGIGDDIRRMPMGMNTLISEGSGGISGGQRQRLMIARAIAPKPRILIFDEATSALDNVTQKKVTESLDKLKCTRIVIAHRLSTIKHYDRILFLEEGKIVEDGTYEELIALNGRFAQMVERQRLDK